MKAYEIATTKSVESGETSSGRLGRLTFQRDLKETADLYEGLRIPNARSPHL